MKVIYNLCVADPWIQVAQKLQQEHGYEPVYWIGYNYDDSQEKVPRVFTNIVYHPNYDAWKGIFPAVIKDKTNASYLDIDFLRSNASFELQAIKMMDRMDANRFSFNFMERQRHYLKLLKSWTACLDQFKPDLVISAVVPHRVHDYVLYLLCRARGIDFISFRNSAFKGRIIPLREIDTIGTYLDAEYSQFLNAELDIVGLKETVANDVLDAYEKVKRAYDDVAEPDHMKQHLFDHQRSTGFVNLTRRLLSEMVKQKNMYCGKNGFLRKGFPTYRKQRNKSIEQSRASLITYSMQILQAIRYKERMKKIYSSLAEKADLNVPYVIFFLHYQPEMTTSPSGDIFVNQVLCLETLLKHMPEDWMLYVKEHRSQFYSHTEGHTARMPEFYRDLKANPRIKLIPLEVDSFTLASKAQAVATITGTVGWEAMVLGKPVIIFGLSWYESYTGVLKVADDRSAAMIPEFISKFKYDERDLLAYLAAFGKRSVKAYYYPGLKQKMNQPENECVANLANSIIEMVGSAQT